MDEIVFIVAGSQAEAEFKASLEHWMNFMWVNHERHLVGKNDLHVVVVEGAESLGRYRQIMAEVERIDNTHSIQEQSQKILYLLADCYRSARDYARVNRLRNWRCITRAGQLEGFFGEMVRVVMVPGWMKNHETRGIIAVAKRQGIELDTLTEEDVA